MKLLLAEDEKDYSRAITVLLQGAQYIVDAVDDGLTALEYARTGNYDGILLDIMMPELDGISVLKTLRSEGNRTPILILTARGGLDDRVNGLDAGADDYLPKPFDYRELLARVRALLRRNDSFAPEILVWADLSLDETNRVLKGPSGEVRLLGREYQLVETFMRNPRILFSTERLMEKLWGWDAEVELNVVWANIYRIRHKIAAVGSRTTIRAQRGVGYCLEDLKS